MMNKEHKTKLANVLKDVENAKVELDKQLTNVITSIVDATETVDEVKESMQEKFDEMSEKVQEGEKGTELEADISSLDTLSDDLGTIKSELEDSNPLDDVINQLKTLTEA
jgi:hypothetical protein